MAAAGRARRPEERTAAHRFTTGATLGLAAGLIGLVLPIALVLLETYEPSVLTPLTSDAVEATGALALVAAVLFALSLIFYRRAFVALRGLDQRFWAASLLCLVGTLGFLLIIVAALLTFSSSGSIAQCLQGAPSRAPSCLRSAALSASDLVVLGLFLVWLGGVGIIVGLALSGRYFRRGAFYGGAAVYAALLIVLTGPALAILYPVANLAYLVLATPVLVLLAPWLVAHGSRAALGLPTAL